MNTRLFLLAAVTFSVALSGCATDRSFGLAEGIEVTELEQLPEPRGDYSYRISPQQTLIIQVVGSELLSGNYLTDSRGFLDFPLVGPIDIDGQAPAVAARIIADALRDRYILNPQVTVIPENFPGPTISVGGEVEQPGSYPAAGQQTLTRIINAAGGLDDFAKEDDVLVMRTVAAQKYIGLYNLAAIQRGNYEDPVLYPNDIVMVGDSPARRRLQTILQLVPIATAASVIVDRTTR